MAASQQVLIAGAGLPAPTTYTTVGTQTVLASFWGSATRATIELYAAGANTLGGSIGGGGGQYAKKNTYSLAGLTGLFLTIPAGGSGAACLVQENSGSGGTIVQAISPTSSTGGTGGTGDVTNDGGSGGFGTGTAGGGAGGSSSAGGNAVGATPGAGGGGLAGAGGTTGFNGGNGVNYGGGAAAQSSALGAQGAIKITWA